MSEEILASSFVGVRLSLSLSPPLLIGGRHMENVSDVVE